MWEKFFECFETIAILSQRQTNLCNTNEIEVENDKATVKMEIVFHSCVNNENRKKNVCKQRWNNVCSVSLTKMMANNNRFGAVSFYVFRMLVVA